MDDKVPLSNKSSPESGTPRYLEIILFFKVSNSSLGLDRASSSTSFAFESSEDENESSYKSPRSNKIQKSPSSSTTDSFMKRASTQTSSDIARSTSLNIPKRRSNSLVSTGSITRPGAESRKTPPGVSASRITEKIAYSTPLSSSSENLSQHRSPSSRTKRSNDKSQMVTYPSIVQATRKKQLANQPTTTTDITKV
jgi:hypothetical protein